MCEEANLGDIGVPLLVLTGSSREAEWATLSDRVSVTGEQPIFRVDFTGLKSNSASQKVTIMAHMSWGEDPSDGTMFGSISLTLESGVDSATTTQYIGGMITSGDLSVVLEEIDMDAGDIATLTVDCTHLPVAAILASFDMTALRCK